MAEAKKDEKAVQRPSSQPTKPTTPSPVPPSPPKPPAQAAQAPARPPTVRPLPPRVIPPPKPLQPLIPARPPPRRDFLKYTMVAGGILSLTPLIPYGQFLTPLEAKKGESQKILLPDGKFANIKTFPANFSQAFPFPRTGDKVKDSEPFRQFVLIRLPKEFGGDKQDVSSLRAYSNVCVHLWCLWRYVPLKVDPSTGKQTHGNLQCPCHGSMYRAPDGLAVRGPASLQSPPQNALPKLDLDVDKDGNILVNPPNWNTNANGVVGFGRYVKEV